MVEWRRLWRDLRAAPGRTALLVMAVAASLAAVGTVLGARAVLVREMVASYASARPAEATLVLRDPVDDAVLERVRARAGEADVREIVLARVEVDGVWKPLLLFVVDDFRELRLNRVTLERGEWPRPGAIALERSAEAVLGGSLGTAARVRAPHGSPTPVTVSGIVHDPALAPASMEREVYGYVDRAGFAALGEAPELHQLLVDFGLGDREAIEARAQALAKELGDVEEIRVPPPRTHPHQRQMETLTALMLAFAVLGLFLAGVVVASALSAVLARQVREIGVLKTLGARRRRIVGWYVALAAGIGAAALLVALPLAFAGAEVEAAILSRVLNFDLQSRAIPAWVPGTLLAAGLGVPVALALPPILGAAGVPVREALGRHGAGGERVRRWLSALPRPLREAARRPARLATTLALLAAGGATFQTALDVRRSWEANVDEMVAARRYDAEIRFEPRQGADVVERARRWRGVREVEAWDRVTAAVARPDGVPSTRTWPDTGHGSFVAMAPPPGSDFETLPLQEGRWLAPGEDDAVVLNHATRPLLPGVRPGDRVELLIGGRPAELRVVGFVREIGSPATAYLTPSALERIAGPGTALIRLRADPEAVAGMELPGVSLILPSLELTDAVSEHVGILVDTLLALALVLGAVGGIGLASTLATSVLERTREIAVRKALGARPRRIARELLAEALSIAVVSWVLATLASLPLAWAMDQLIGSLGFLAALPYRVSGHGVLAWLGLVVVLAAVGTVMPARAAARLRVVEGLASV